MLFMRMLHYKLAKMRRYRVTVRRIECVDLYGPNDTKACHYNSLELLKIIDDDGSGLNDWEAGFVEDMLEKSEALFWDPFWAPSESQRNKLLEIFQRRVVDA